MVAFEALVEHVCRGRWADARQPSEKELQTTLVLRLVLNEVSAKVRTGGPKDGEADLALPVWAGEIPLRTRPGAPVRHELLGPEIATPRYADTYSRPGWTD